MNRKKEVEKIFSDLEAKHHAERQELIALETCKTLAMDKFPVEGAKFHQFCVHSDIACEIEQDSLQKALILLSVIQEHLLPMVEVKNTHCSHLPKHAVLGNEKELARPIGKFIMQVNGLRQYGDEQSIVCYVPIDHSDHKPILEQIDDDSIQIWKSMRLTIKIKNPFHKIRRDWSERYYKGDTCVKDTHLIQDLKLFREKVAWYSSSEQPTKYTLTKPVGDPCDLLVILGADVVENKNKELVT